MWSFAVEDNLDPKINKKKYNTYSLIYHFWHKRYPLLFILTNHIPFKYLVQKFVSLLTAVYVNLESFYSHKIPLLGVLGLFTDPNDRFP